MFIDQRAGGFRPRGFDFSFALVSLFHPSAQLALSRSLLYHLSHSFSLALYYFHSSGWQLAPSPSSPLTWKLTHKATGGKIEGILFSRARIFPTSELKKWIINASLKWLRNSFYPKYDYLLLFLQWLLNHHNNTAI